jgi:sugar phosphate isomerase/epimerase
MAKKLSIGSWAYAFGPYADNPIPFDTVVRRLGELDFDGVEVAGFKPHVHPEDYPMKSDREKIKNLIKVNNLGISGLAADFWATPGPATDAGQKDDFYFKLFKKNLQLCLDLGAPAIRVDTAADPEKGVEGVDRKTAWNRIVSVWKRCAQVAEKNGVRMVWEFEPGFMFNKPGEVVQMVEDVGHPNFKVMFNTSHTYTCAVMSARQPAPKETLKGGVVEFARMLKGKIGHLHLINSDGTLHGGETSVHYPFDGPNGKIDFNEAIPAIVEDAGYNGDWWTIDLCFWPDAWEVTEASKKFLEPYLERY